MRDRLMIGIGNVMRGDDGVGPAAAARVRGLESATVRSCSDLIEVWRDRDDVVVVDAMFSGAPSGTIRVFDAVAKPLPEAPFTSSHDFGLPAVVELSRALGCLPGSLVVYGIEADSFEGGEGLSEPVREALRTVVARIESGID